jgi:predicted acyltransferase
VPGQGGIGAHWLDTPGKTLAAWVDRALLDGHLWRNSRTWDPEGVLSTIPSVGTVMLGVLAGRWLGRETPLTERLSGLFAVGALLMMLGLMWHWSFPINKSLWTSSYVIFTGGMAAVSLATILWITDVQRMTWWTRPFVIYGVNPIIAFVGSGMMARTMGSLIKLERGGETQSLQWVIHHLLAMVLEPRNASLSYAVLFVVFWFGILWLLNRRGMILKV